MIGKIVGVLCLVSIVFAIFSGNLANMTDAIISGAESAVQLVISLIAMMALWSGVMEVFSEAGAIRLMAKILNPIMRLMFPYSVKNNIATEEIAASIAANLLGLGNAATPIAIRAMEKLDHNNPNFSSASDDMITFTVIGCTSFVLLPSTLIALRVAANSADPFEIILPVWVASGITMVLSVVLCRVFNSVFRDKATTKTDN